MNPTSETCMSHTGLFIHFVILLRVDRPYMAAMVYHGIYLIYHRYLPQLKALMLPTQSDMHQTVGFLINGIVLESKPYVHAFMKFHTNYNDPAHDAKLSMTMPNFQFWHDHYGNFVQTSFFQFTSAHYPAS